jgi:hypothetical protein
VADNLGRLFVLWIAADRVWLETCGYCDCSACPIVRPTTDGDHNYRLVVAAGKGSLFMDDDLVQSVDVGRVEEYPYPNYVYFGDGTACGTSETYLMHFSVSTPQFTVAPDTDGDRDVDLSDFARFQGCFNGPNRDPSRPACCGTDFDEDGDVDLTDFAVFQACFNGPNRPPACAA